MKKKICLALSILMIAVFLGGCNLFAHNYERDFGQVVATISSITEEIEVVEETKNDAHEVISTEKRTYVYTSPEITILKSQLNNYVQNYATDRINQGQSIEQIVDELLNSIIETELGVLEADKLFYAGLVYWTEKDVAEIQRSVYEAIDEEILIAKNYLLSLNEYATIESNSNQEQDVNTGSETTFPVMPVEEEEEEESPKYYKTTPAPNEATYQWHDEWYTDTNNKWYIEDSSYSLAYPGLSPITDKISEKNASLEKNAFNAYLESLYITSESIIGLTADQKQTIDGEIEMLKRITREQGVSYAYPVLGKTLLIKLLIGNTYLKSKKIEKYELYKRAELNNIGFSSVSFKYEDVLRNQKTLFATESNYDTAVQNGDLILYTPNDRYLYVKHILLSFSNEQKAQLEKIASDLGYVASAEKKINEEEYLRRRQQLAEQIVAYEHINGENDLTRPKKATDVFNEVRNTLKGYKNSSTPKYAEQAFDELVYKYNTDPGFFDKISTGYAVVYELREGEQDTWVPEFSAGAKEFRSNSNYSVGNVLDYYVVTDHGIHILYYASDTVANQEKGLYDYVNNSGKQTIYSYYEELLISESKEYENWSSARIKQLKNTKVSIVDSVVANYLKQLNG